MTEAEREAAFSTHPLVRACTKEIAITIAKPRLEIGRQIGDEWRPIDFHWALDLIETPNEEYSRNDFFQYITLRYLLTGVGYAWKLRNKRASRITELWPIPTSWVTPIANRSGTRLLAGYRAICSESIIPLEDMIKIRMVDPGSSVGYSSPLQAALHDYQLDLSRQNYQAEMLENLKVPGVAVVMERPLTPAQEAAARKDFNEKFGKGHRMDPIFLYGNGKVEIINPLADLDWPGLTEQSETRICVAFGVPPIVVHARAGLTRATYSNYEQARKAFYVETMSPHWDALADALTHGLLRMEDEGDLRFKFRYDEMPEFQEDLDRKTLRVTQSFTAGILSRDEARVELGYPPEGEIGDTGTEDTGSGDAEDTEDTEDPGNQAPATKDQQAA
jgi:HK97 family phage portal protein